MNSPINSKVGVEYILRIYLDGDWTIAELSRYLQSISDYYDINTCINSLSSSRMRRLSAIAVRESSILALKELIYNPDAQTATTIDRTIEPQRHRAIVLQLYPLENIRIVLQSPGINDVTGAAGILQQLKETFFYYFPNLKDRLSNQDKEIDIEIKRQKLYQEQINTLKAASFSDEEIRIIMLKGNSAFKKLSEFVEKGKITGVADSDDFGEIQ